MATTVFSERRIALCGNPNVGKSTLFNALTGLRQHTGNWPGKTVAAARGSFTYEGETLTLLDLPGTYSLFPGSAEEEVTRDALCFSAPDAVLLVADATCLQRSLALALQVLELTRAPTVLCVNLMDEAEKRGVNVALDALSRELGIPVVGTSARGGEGLDALRVALLAAVHAPKRREALHLAYPAPIERAIRYAEPTLAVLFGQSSRALALHLLQGDDALAARLGEGQRARLQDALSRARVPLEEAKLTEDDLRDAVAGTLARRARELFETCVTTDEARAQRLDRRLDRLFTSRLTGIPVMLGLLGLILWLTISGANAPSALLSRVLFSWQEPLRAALVFLPERLCAALTDGVYRTVAWVVAVMLPPMAIFFPLFTLLEDVGYLPRVAFVLDRAFARAGAHGRQSLTMCMGLGCNACGVTGCRIIGSPRERLIAMLTNSLVPCNGRFPLLIALLTCFFVGADGGTLRPALLLLGALLLAVGATLFASRLLSRTLLRGEASAFSLELPPYRMPRVGQVLVRSLFDRTLFVLGRAVTVAAPAGLLIWLLANSGGEESFLSRAAALLDPAARLLGLDGMILLAFLLALPANELVLPVLLMGYCACGTLVEYESLSSLHLLLTANGWTAQTALCTALFSLLHFPCGTTLLTLRRETGSWRWTLVGALLPTLMGCAVCMAVHAVCTLFA